MQTQVALLVVWTLGIYLGVGVVFALPFVVRAVGRIDPSAAAGSVGFRLLILPGVIALWPWMLRRLVAGTAPRSSDSAHDPAAGGGGE